MQLKDKNLNIEKVEKVVLNRNIHGENMIFKKEFDSKKVTLELLKNRLKQQKK